MCPLVFISDKIIAYVDAYAQCIIVVMCPNYPYALCMCVCVYIYIYIYIYIYLY